MNESLINFNQFDQNFQSVPQASVAYKIGYILGRFVRRYIC